MQTTGSATTIGGTLEFQLSLLSRIEFLRK